MIDTIPPIDLIRAKLCSLYEKNNSVRDYNESFTLYHRLLEQQGLRLINKENHILLGDIRARIYCEENSRDYAVFVIYLPQTNSMIFPATYDLNCPQELADLFQRIKTFFTGEGK